MSRLAPCVRRLLRPVGPELAQAGRPLLAALLLAAAAPSRADDTPPTPPPPPPDQPAPAPPTETKLTLDSAIRLALEKNFAIQVESFGPLIARAALAEARGRFDPRLTGSYYEHRDKTPRLPDPLTGLRPAATVTQTNETALALAGQLPLGTTYQLAAAAANDRGTHGTAADTYTTYGGLTLTQPLLRDFGLHPALYRIRIARTNHAIAEWEYRLTVTQTVTQVIYAYSDLHLAHARLRSALRSREMAAQLSNENEGRRRRGAMSEFDVLSARARVARSEEGVLSARRNLSVVENALKQLISDDRTPELLTRRLAIDALPAPAELALDAATAFRTALAQRPEYHRALLAAKQGDLARRYERNQLLPSLDLTGSYGYNGIAAASAASRADARGKDFPSWTTGVTLSVPLTSATERGRARAAALRHRQAETEVQRLEQDILIAIGNAVQQVETTRLRVATTQTARELNEQMLDSELKRLRAGTGSTFNVLYQQEQLSSAEIAEALARADHRKALADYDRQTGRTLETHRIGL